MFEERYLHAVPKNYFPAVEKELQTVFWVLGGYPVVGIKAHWWTDPIIR